MRGLGGGGLGTGSRFEIGIFLTVIVENLDTSKTVTVTLSTTQVRVMLDDFNNVE